MRSEYKRDVHNNYLVLENEKQVEETSYPVRMLLANVLPMFLRCRLQGMDGKMLFYYEITSKQSLEALYEKKKFSFEDLQILFSHFTQLLEKMEEYLLNPDQLVLQPEFIYMDAERKHLCFCYLPGYEKPISEQFRSLTEYVLPKLDHEDAQAVMLGYGIYRRALEEEFQLEHLKEEIFQPAKKTEKNPEERECFEALYRKEKSEKASSREQSLLFQEEERKLSPEEEMQFTGSRKKRSWWKSLLILLLSCMLAAGWLLGIIFLENQGYLPQLRTELMIACGIGMMGLFSLIGFLFQKLDQRGKETKASVSSARKGRKAGKQMEGRDTRSTPNAERSTAVMEMEQFLDTSPGWNKTSDMQLHEWKKAGEMPAYERNKADEILFYENNRGSERLPHEGNKNSEMPSYERMPGEFRSPEILRSSGSKESGSGMKHYQKGQPNYGETVILAEEPIKGPAALVSREPGELATIYLQEDLTIIGKMENAADAVIPLPTISRVHAKIRKKGDGYYLTDLNSRNGTAVNGRMLKMEEEYLLQQEDQVDFAQARYIFLQ